LHKYVSRCRRTYAAKIHNVIKDQFPNAHTEPGRSLHVLGILHHTIKNRPQGVCMKTEQVANDTLNSRELLKVLNAFKRGDFSVRMPVEKTGIAGKIADSINEIIELNEKMAREFARISIA